MKRVYIKEKQSFLNEKGYELAQAYQRFNNAFGWYQSKPEMGTHLDSMQTQLARINAIMQEIVDSHEVGAMLEPNSVKDPDKKGE